MRCKFKGRSALLITVVAVAFHAASADPFEKAVKIRRLELKPAEGASFASEARSTGSGGTWIARYEPETRGKSVPLSAIHSWKLVLSGPDGRPVVGAKLEIDGDMPQHGHGLPTRPSVEEMGSGAYRVSGLKFNMQGWWVVRVSVSSVKDLADFEFNIKVL